VTLDADTAPSTCARCDTAIEAGDLRCAVCAQATPVRPSVREQREIVVVRCDECGAAIRYDERAQAPRCAFCGSVTHIEGITDPMEAMNWQVHFTVAPQAAQASLQTWLGGLGWLRPSDLRQRARLEGLQPIWWAGWAFRARALVSWTADSNAGSRRADWAPHAGQTELDFDALLVPATRGLSSDEAEALASSYDLEDGGERGRGPDGAFVEQFDVQRSAARQQIIAAAHAVARQRVTTQHVPGTRHRHVHAKLVIRGLETRRCGLPAYILAYRYRDRVYRAVISGQDADRVIGAAPYSWIKISLLAVAIATAALLLLTVR
jgi:hypothetical protein